MNRLSPKTYEEALAKKQARAAKRKPAKKKAKKRVKTSTLKNKVWTQFSIFIRTRGADSAGFNTCFTCNVRKFWRDLQAGHFIRGRLNANLFNEVGCWPQCYSCNVGQQGNVVIYYKKMLEKYGQGMIDVLIRQNNQTKKWQAGELANLLTHYSELNKTNPIVSLGLQPTDSQP